MSEPTPRSNDPLRHAWQAARQLDGDPAPSPEVRARILAQARSAQARATDVRPHGRDRARPANDFRWRITAIAAVMTLSLAGWLAWQLRYGAPDEPVHVETASAPVAAPAAPAAAAGGDARRDEARKEARGQARVGDRTEERVAAARAPAGAASLEQPVSATADHEDRESRRRAPASKAGPAPEPAPASESLTSESLTSGPSTLDAAATPARASAASPARTAAASPAQTLIAASASGDLDGIRRALADGAAIDAADAHGRTPLLAAVCARRVAAVRLLLEAGADPNHADRDGVAPLQHARSREDAAIADLLIAAGAR